VDWLAAVDVALPAVLVATTWK
jgi:uncharacterized membrane protein YhdT